MTILNPFAMDLETIAAPDIIPMLPEVKPSGRLKDKAKISADIKDKKAKQISSMGMDPLHNRIITASLYDGKKCHSYQSTDDGPMSEEKLICWFWETVFKSGYNYMIGFNSRVFDLRCLLLHGARYRVKPSVTFNSGKYNRGNHLDLRPILSGEGQFQKGKLDFYMQYFGVSGGKEGMSGDQVQAAFDFGEFQSIQNYCNNDAKDTWNIYEILRDGGLCI